jgi:hypothetical protein
MEKNLAAKAAGFPSLCEALSAIVPPLNALNRHPLFSRLAYGRDFLSNKIWAPFLKSTNSIFEEWLKEDRAAAERDLYGKKDAAKRRIEEEGRQLIADLMVEEEQPAEAEGVAAS